jgi:hypothetical protein
MTIDATCPVCANPNRRRLIELGLNNKMDAIGLAALWDDLTSKIIQKHTRHTDLRNLVVVTTSPSRERVENLQRMQLDEIERRVALAQQEAGRRNDAIDDAREMGVEGADALPYHDWSEYFNILDKDVQAAIGSIQRTQGLSDKRETSQGALKLGLFEAMANAGLAPKSLIGGPEVKVLPPGDTDGGV